MVSIVLVGCAGSDGDSRADEDATDRVAAGTIGITTDVPLSSLPRDVGSPVPSTNTTSLSASATAPISGAGNPPDTSDALDYVVPVAEPASASWGDTHSAYPATDIFLNSGCEGDIVSPVDGVLLEVRRVDEWDEGVDNPATRGGRSIAIRGDDGVRYYLAHFDTIDAESTVGNRVTAGEHLGTVGETGRTSACHVHFGISPPCPDKEWSIRRGVIWPYPYLDAWTAGEQRSPASEVGLWLAANPTACADASADAFAQDS